MIEGARGLSVRQPWAQLILMGRKTIEIRPVPAHYRGRIWLHASRTVDEHAERRFRLGHLFTGGFIGSVELLASSPILGRERWEQLRPQHHVDAYRKDQWAWFLADPRPLREPLAASGKLGLFPIDEHTLEQLLLRFSYQLGGAG